MLGVVYLYCCQEKHSIHKFEVYKGYYKIQITGNICIQNYNSTGNDDFQLYLYTDGWNSQSVKIHGKSMYSYSYSFTGTFLVNLKKRE
jgi:hypothetical protein